MNISNILTYLINKPESINQDAQLLCYSKADASSPDENAHLQQELSSTEIEGKVVVLAKALFKKGDLENMMKTLQVHNWSYLEKEDLIAGILIDLWKQQKSEQVFGILKVINQNYEYKDVFIMRLLTDFLEQDKIEIEAVLALFKQDHFEPSIKKWYIKRGLLPKIYSSDMKHWLLSLTKLYFSLGRDEINQYKLIQTYMKRDEWKKVEETLDYCLNSKYFTSSEENKIAKEIAETQLNRWNATNDFYLLKNIKIIISLLKNCNLQQAYASTAAYAYRKQENAQAAIETVLSVGDPIFQEAELVRMMTENPPALDLLNEELINAQYCKKIVPTELWERIFSYADDQVLANFVTAFPSITSAFILYKHQRRARLLQSARLQVQSLTQKENSLNEPEKLMLFRTIFTISFPSVPGIEVHKQIWKLVILNRLIAWYIPSGSTENRWTEEEVSLCRDLILLINTIKVSSSTMQLLVDVLTENLRKKEKKSSHCQEIQKLLCKYPKESPLVDVLKSLCVDNCLSYP